MLDHSRLPEIDRDAVSQVTNAVLSREAELLLKSVPPIGPYLVKVMRRELALRVTGSNEWNISFCYNATHAAQLFFSRYNFASRTSVSLGDSVSVHSRLEDYETSFVVNSPRRMEILNIIGVDCRLHTSTLLPVLALAQRQQSKTLIFCFSGTPNSTSASGLMSSFSKGTNYGKTFNSLREFWTLSDFVRNSLWSNFDISEYDGLAEDQLRGCLSVCDRPLIVLSLASNFDGIRACPDVLRTFISSQCSAWNWTVFADSAAAYSQFMDITQFTSDKHRLVDVLNIAFYKRWGTPEGLGALLFRILETDNKERRAAHMFDGSRNVSFYDTTSLETVQESSDPETAFEPGTPNLQGALTVLMLLIRNELPPDHNRMEEQRLLLSCSEFAPAVRLGRGLLGKATSRSLLPTRLLDEVPRGFQRSNQELQLVIRARRNFFLAGVAAIHRRIGFEALRRMNFNASTLLYSIRDAKGLFITNQDSRLDLGSLGVGRGGLCCSNLNFFSHYKPQNIHKNSMSSASETPSSSPRQEEVIRGYSIGGCPSSADCGMTNIKKSPAILRISFGPTTTYSKIRQALKTIERALLCLRTSKELGSVSYVKVYAVRGMIGFTVDGQWPIQDGALMGDRYYDLRPKRLQSALRQHIKTHDTGLAFESDNELEVWIKNVIGLFEESQPTPIILAKDNHFLELSSKESWISFRDVWNNCSTPEEISALRRSLGFLVVLPFHSMILPLSKQRPILISANNRDTTCYRWRATSGHEAWGIRRSKHPSKDTSMAWRSQLEAIERLGTQFNHSWLRLNFVIEDKVTIPNDISEKELVRLALVLPPGDNEGLTIGDRTEITSLSPISRCSRINESTPTRRSSQGNQTVYKELKHLLSRYFPGVGQVRIGSKGIAKGKEVRSKPKTELRNIRSLKRLQTMHSESTGLQENEYCYPSAVAIQTHDNVFGSSKLIEQTSSEILFSPFLLGELAMAT